MVDVGSVPFGQIRTFDGVEWVLFQLTDNIDKLIGIIEKQTQRIEQLEDAIFTIAPELETIDLMANDEGERQRLVSIYLNRNENFLYERNRRRDYDWGHDGDADFRNDNSHSSKTDDSEYGCVKYSDREAK